MENLPFYISAIFIIATTLTILFLYKAFRQSKLVLFICLGWLFIQSIIALTGFYTITDSAPPRFLLLVLLPILLIVILFSTSSGRKFMDRSNTKWLTWLHTVRVPVEITLFLLFTYKQVPELMTFEGRNLDILSGITAPLIAYFGYTRMKLNRTILLIWNFICLMLLTNIVVNAILSVPTPFQRFAFDQPNVAILYFPFIWLPCFVVPAVLLSHLVSIRELVANRKKVSYASTLVPTV